MANKNKYHKDYMKERRRIQSFIYRRKKQGYIIPDRLLPNIPRKITLASINRLKKLTPDILYKKLEYIDFETGKTLKGKKPKDKKSKVKQKKKSKVKTNIPLAEDIILNNLKSELQQITPAVSQSNFLKEIKREAIADIIAMIDDAVIKFGKNVVARRIESNAVIINRCIQTIMNSSDSPEIQLAIDEIMSIIYNGALSKGELEAISNAMEYYEDYS